MDMDHTRKQFEDAVFGRYFLSTIKRTGLGGCLTFMPDPEKELTQAELCARDGEGYARDDVSAMWWGWCQSLTIESSWRTKTDNQAITEAQTKQPAVTSEAIGQVLTSILTRADNELLESSAEELEKLWYFRWDPSASPEWNIYKFSGALEAFKRSCRRWEEQHSGNTCCVVERVRDKYLMPKIKAFLAELSASNK